MFYCYILFSPKLNSYYVGITQDTISSRLEKHNNQSYGATYTSKTSDWEIYLEINCSSVAHSVQIEKHIKAMKSKVYIENLKKYPEMIEKLLTKF